MLFWGFVEKKFVLSFETNLLIKIKKFMQNKFFCPSDEIVTTLNVMLFAHSVTGLQPLILFRMISFDQ